MAIRLEGFFYKDEINVPYLKKAEQLKKLRHVEEALSREYPLLSTHLDKGICSLANSARAFEIKKSSEQFKKRAYTSYYRAKKTQECFQSDHYVVFHSRSLALKVVSYFIKKMVEATHPGINLKGFDLLRYPENSPKDATGLLKTPCPDMGFEGGSKLLSASPNLLSKGFEESVTHFFLANASIKAQPTPVVMGDPNSESQQEDLVRKICTPILAGSLAKQIPNWENQMETCIKKVQTLFNAVSKLEDILPGELLLICIPKPLIQETLSNPLHEDSLLYRSSCYGIATALPADKSLEVLEEEQKALETLQEDAQALEKMEQDLSEQLKIITTHTELRDLDQLFEDLLKPTEIKKPEPNPACDAAKERISALEKKIAELKAKPKPSCDSQYRLFTDRLTPKKGIQIIGIDPMGKNTKNDYYKSAIKKMVAELPLFRA